MQLILQTIEQAGGRCLKVGGCVRDALLGVESKDVDVEVYGLPYDELVGVLKQFGRVFTVGKSFGVIKLTHAGEDYDFSLPRRDNKVGEGHRGFVAEADHTLSPVEAALRRDFTINAMGEGLDGKLVDPYNGKADLEAKVLRATSEHFAEDPLRVLRGMQFAARFEMTVESETASMCQSLANEFHTIAAERIWGEFEKLCLKGQKPSMAIQFLIDTGWIELFPLLNAMKDSPQDPVWHPEGWSITDLGLLPFDLSLTSSTKPTSVDCSSLGEFFSGTVAELTGGPTLTSTPSAKSTKKDSSIDCFSGTGITGSFDFGFSASSMPAIITQPKSLVWLLSPIALEATPSFRIMFKVPSTCVKSIMVGSINDFEIVQRIIHSVSVFVMDMLGSKQFSPDVKFHQNSVNTDGSIPVGATGIGITSVVVDAASSAIDGDVIVYLDFAIVGNFQVHNDSPFNTLHSVSMEHNEQKIPTFEVNQGDVLTHTMHCMDAAVEVADRQGVEGEDRVVLMLAVLCHDIGKPNTLSQNEDGRYINHGHAEEGVPVAKEFLNSIGAFPRIIERVLPLVKFHMVHTSMSEEHITGRFVRRLARNMGKSSIAELAMVMESDHSGRPPLEKGMNPLTQRILDVAEEVKVQDSVPKPILNGRDLIVEFNVQGSPAFKPVLDAAYEAQLNGVFDSVEGGLEFVHQQGFVDSLA